MDIFTHSIWGYLLKKNFFDINSKKILSLFLISSVFPDIDVLWSYNNHDLHRVLTHSLITIPFICFILSILFYYIFKKEIKFYKVFFICLSWMLLHVFLDSIVVWWVPLFWPINKEYYSLNLYTYVIEPLFFPIYLLFFVFLLWIIKKLNSKVIKIISIYMICIFWIKFWLMIYANSISNSLNIKTIWIINKNTDLTIQRYYGAITTKDNKINSKIVDVFEQEVIDNYEKDIYIDKTNLCSDLHKWFLYTENWFIWDIRYSLELWDNNSCFNWKRNKVNSEWRESPLGD